MDYEQIRANSSIQRIDHPGFGELRQPRLAAQLDKTPAAIAGPGRRRGQHDSEILAGLGYTAAKVYSWIGDRKILVSD